MISTAIQSSLVMIPIILIVHLLLKHILIDKMNDRPQPLLKHITHNNKNENEDKNMVEKKKRAEVDVEREEEEEEEDKGDKDDKDDNDKKREIEGHKDEEIYLKKRLARLQEDKEKESNKKTYGPSPKIKFQERRPAESETKITPEKDDVFSFVLQGDPSPSPSHSSSPYSSPSHDVHSIKNKSHSFFNEPHYPKTDSRNELFEDNKEKGRERGREIASNRIEMGEMGEMYSDHMFTKKGVSDNTDLFNNIGAANSDGEETSLDEIFRQTQVPNTK